jgi:hypothetical protein
MIRMAITTGGPEALAGAPLGRALEAREERDLADLTGRTSP